MSLPHCRARPSTRSTPTVPRRYNCRKATTPFWFRQYWTHRPCNAAWW
tara:strand:+ start:84734 stop:84877 length:144 start_codon:yes stop_codon:yes gene_type:complete